MGKISVILKTEVQRQLTYRVNFFAYRIGTLIEIAAQVIVWAIVFRGATTIQGYTYREMLTYIIVGWFFTYFTINYLFERLVSKQIADGTLSQFLTKPFHYIKYIITLSVGRISVALTVAALVQGALIVVFYKQMIINTHVLTLLLIAGMLIVGYLIKVVMAVTLGFLSFWITEIDGIHGSANILIKFFAGTYFPLSILPGFWAKVGFFLPFGYTFSIPTELYVGKMPFLTGLLGFGVECVWLVILCGIMCVVWKKGIKQYEGVGI